MGTQRKGARVSDDQEELTRRPLQAILLADSFTTKFRPITLERPKVLLPLVNVPMIDYTLAWLESAEVEEVFVFCCAHSRQVIDYLDNSGWLSQPNFTVTPIESHNAVSVGDALRTIYERHVIHGDFVLISGDTVSNMSLTQVVQEHKERRKKDKYAVMTMVVKKSKPSPTHQSRLGTDELFMAINPSTKQLLYYEDKAEHAKGTVSLDKTILADNPSILLHNDKQDCYIDICSEEVLSLFTDNFDYQHLRRHFVKGLLVDDIMGYKIFTHELQSSYAASIDNFRSYDTVSKDIIQRWTFPYVPDVNFCGNRITKAERQGVYRASGVTPSRSAQIGPFAVIGCGTKIGSETKISNSVIGEGCIIGSHVSIEGSYIWDNVTIEDGCDLKHAVVCNGVMIKAGATLQSGVITSYKVVIGREFVVPAYSKVSLHQQPTKQDDSDEELEYADNSNDTAELPSIAGAEVSLNGDLTSEVSKTRPWISSELGTGGAGNIWSNSEGISEEEWRHSVAPITEEKLAEITQITDDDYELLAQEVPTSVELRSDSESDYSGEFNNEDCRDFEKEVDGTFLRAVEENVKIEHVILEVSSLRLSFNMESEDCAGALFDSMMKYALGISHSSAAELLRNTTTVLTTWKKLLKAYSKQVDEQIEVILRFQDMCLKSGKDFTPLFEKILQILYDRDILEEEAILKWAEEQEGAEESEKVFVKQSENFIKWLKEASEEEDEEDD